MLSLALASPSQVTCDWDRAIRAAAFGALAPSTRQRVQRTSARYTVICNEAQLAPWPPTKHTIAAFALHRARTICASSVETEVHQLRLLTNAPASLGPPPPS